MLCNYQRGPEPLFKIFMNSSNNRVFRDEEQAQPMLPAFPNRQQDREPINVADVVSEALEIIDNGLNQSNQEEHYNVETTSEEISTSLNNTSIGYSEQQNHQNNHIRWQKAPLHPYEDVRMEILRATNILGTNPEDRYDCITSAVKERFDVPIVLVSLVDQHRQWFKSAQGLDAKETPRDQAFCAHAILQDHKEVLCVPDATKDERFADNPLVTSGPMIRFYAGVPLRVGCINVGTLCLMDTKPRSLSQTDVQSLIDMSLQVEAELVKTFSPARLSRSAKTFCALGA